MNRQTAVWTSVFLAALLLLAAIAAVRVMGGSPQASGLAGTGSPFTISGTVTGPDGPVAGALVYYLAPCDQEFGNTVRTDASGHYTFTLETPATVCIVAVPPLHTRLAQAQRRITVTGDTSGVDITVAPGRLLSGRVVDQNGRPADVRRSSNIVPASLDLRLYDTWDGDEPRRWWLAFNEFSEFTLFLPPGEYFMTGLEPFPAVDLRDGDVDFWEVVVQAEPWQQRLPDNVTWDEPPPLVDRITLSPPDEAGRVHITGAPGAIPTDIPHLRVVNLFTGDFTTVPVAADGSFQADITAPYGSALHLRYSYWREYYWAEATGTTLWVYPPDVGPRQDGSTPFYLSGAAGNAGWWAADGLINTLVFTHGDTLSVTLNVTVTSPAIDESFDTYNLWLSADLNMEPFFDARGWPRQRVNRGGSFLLAPTGIPIENNALWRSSGYTPLTIQQSLQLTAAHRISHTLRATLHLSGTIPPDLPPAHYRPALFLRLERRDVPWDPQLARVEMNPLLMLPDEEAPPRVEGTFLTNYGAYYLPLVRVGDPAPPRLIWHLLTNTFSNGVRGTTAREDRGHFALSTRIAYQTDHLIVPRVEDHSRLPITYRLEPFLPMVSYSLVSEAIPPRIPLAFPSGQLHVVVQRPDGTVDDLGTAPFRQARQGMAEPRYHYYLGSDRAPQRFYEITTLSPQFEYQFPAYGHYVITMTGTMEDIWGNTYQGGGTYDVYVAEPLDLEGIFPGTPFEVGDALSPVVTVQPGVPATVTLQFRLYPNSDPAQAVIRTLTGRANRFGYFHPGSQTSSRGAEEQRGRGDLLPCSSAPQLPCSLDAPGEYVLDITAQYWDENGVLWMGSARGAGVVETPNSTLVAHGQRGVTQVMDNRPQWFFFSQLHPEGVKEVGSGTPTDTQVMVVYPYHSGDVLWVADTGDAIIGEITVQDTEGSFADLVLSRAYQSNNPSNHFGGLEIPERVAVGEIPLFNTTATGLNPALFPEAIDQWGYFYLSAQRPGISVRAYIGQAWFFRTYWGTDYKYDRQFGQGLQGDLANDVKIQLGGAVVRLLGDLDDPSDDRNEYLGYASTEILIPLGTEGGNRVFPAFQGCSGGPSGGPLFTLKGREINVFITPEGVHPGAVLEVGDTFSFAGAIWPNLDSRVWITATSPSGAQHVIQGRADRYGYFYEPDGDFVVDEPGRWTVDVHLVHDAVVPSTGLPPTCHNTGDVLGSRDGQFTIYVVERDAPPLALDISREQFLSGPVPVVFSGTIPSGWQNVTGTFTALMSGYILEEGELTIAGDRFSYTFDPLRLHRDFPNLEVEEPDGAGVLADTFTFTFLLSGQDEMGQVQHRARIVTLQGQRLMAPLVCIPRDLDCDCQVGLNDIMLVATRWHSRAGDEGYELAHDLNRDGEVNVVDIMLVAADWGKRCGAP